MRRVPPLARASRDIVLVRGTKRQAQAVLTSILVDIDKDQHVDPHKVTVAEFVPGARRPMGSRGRHLARTAQRYRQLVENQIAPHIGAKALQKLTRLDIEGWHNALQGGLAARTIGHAHRVLAKALSDARKRRPGRQERLQASEGAQGRRQRNGHRAGRAGPRGQAGRCRLYVPAMVALFTGMRLGEVLALRWGRVDLDRKSSRSARRWSRLRRGYDSRRPNPRPAAGTSPCPILLVDTLREHRRAALKLRMQLGADGLPDDALLFATSTGSAPAAQRIVGLGRLAERIGMPE